VGVPLQSSLLTPNTWLGGGRRAGIAAMLGQAQGGRKGVPPLGGLAGPHGLHRPTGPIHKKNF
jgi:hypothetical protein